MEIKKNKFKLRSEFKPAGDQAAAIKGLVSGIRKGKSMQTLLGVTGSGKTFTMANVIARVNKPTLIMAHNKTLAAQLYEEMREFFPENRVEYFISYYDYYQPESYLPAKDQYIEKDSAINPRIEQMRHATTASLLSRSDVIVVASVSCIYGLSNPEVYKMMGCDLNVGDKMSRRDFIKKLVGMTFERNDLDLISGRFRVKGDVVDLVPGYGDNIIRVEFFGDEVERIVEIDKNTGEIIDKKKYFYVWPARNYVVPEEVFDKAVAEIRAQLKVDLNEIGDELVAHRLKQRTNFDIEMIQETGTCKGIENYSRHFDGRAEGEKAFCLLDYFPKNDFLIIVDESHRTLPQVGGMFNGDRARKKNLIDYGFRLTSAFDNRPLKFDEFEGYMKGNSAVFVSATPGDYEEGHSDNVVEQIIRPTGLIDPEVEIRPITPSEDGKVLGQVKDCLIEIDKAVKNGSRVLLTTLTKRMAEELTDFLGENGVKCRYMHSEIDTLERTEILRELRLGKFDVLVGINLLREGIDIPEIGFVGVLDADKEGFLRDARSLIQIIGRAARNREAYVVLYADNETGSIKKAIAETNRRRAIQVKHNEKHGIVPKSIVKPIRDKKIEIRDVKGIPKAEIKNVIIELEADMKDAAEELDFERAIYLRGRVGELNKRLSGK
jgi:excinuclease ABC subunit B